MVTIYADYGDEPEDQFIPIPDHLACRYYDLEMDSYIDDAVFFDTILPEDASILELGCGSGRIGRHLVNGRRKITGVDISLPMLQRAQRRALPSMYFYAMDMTALAFTNTFHSIVIPYNSLNLLITQERILRCLKGCRQYLRTGGLLAAQIFIPTQQFLAYKKKSFQFQIFNMLDKGRLIKEIKKEYLPESKTIAVEERFRVRPAAPEAAAAAADYSKNYTVAAYEIADWLHLFESSGFTITNGYEDFLKTPLYSTDSSTLVVVCK